MKEIAEHLKENRRKLKESELTNLSIEGKKHKLKTHKGSFKYLGRVKQ